MIQGFTIQTLAPTHQRARFHCASPSLDDFIHKRARAHNANDTTRVHVLADPSGRIAGFYTLSAHMLELHGLPESIQKGRPRFPVPATLLGRFAVDNEFAGKGVGRWLLAHALRTAHAADRLVGSAIVVLDLAPDAAPSAQELYASVGFIRLESTPSRMILPMETIARSVP